MLNKQGTAYTTPPLAVIILKRNKLRILFVNMFTMDKISPTSQLKSFTPQQFKITKIRHFPVGPLAKSTFIELLVCWTGHRNVIHWTTRAIHFFPLYAVSYSVCLWSCLFSVIQLLHGWLPFLPYYRNSQR